MKNLFIYILLIFLLGVNYSCTSKSGRLKRARNSATNKNKTNKSNPRQRNNTSFTTNNSSSNNTSNNNNTNTNNNSSSLNSMYNNLKGSVFLILNECGSSIFQGTGFIISNDGMAISNYHVFEGCTFGKEKLKMNDGRVYKVDRVIKKSKKLDYIIFKLNNYNSNNYLSLSSQMPEIGSKVFTIGNPKGLTQTLSEGIVSGYRENKDYIQTSTEITHGSSGGPLFNMNGEVVGITTSGVGEANLNFCVNILKLNL